MGGYHEQGMRNSQCRHEEHWFHFQTGNIQRGETKQKPDSENNLNTHRSNDKSIDFVGCNGNGRGGCGGSGSGVDTWRNDETGGGVPSMAGSPAHTFLMIRRQQDVHQNNKNPSFISRVPLMPS